MERHVEQRLALIDAVLHELFRSGVVTDAMMNRVAVRFDGESRMQVGERREFFTELADAARLLPMMAAGESASDYEARVRRAHMVERTRLIDGGKSDG